jgi:hypothetical protein
MHQHKKDILIGLAFVTVIIISFLAFNNEINIKQRLVNHGNVNQTVNDTNEKTNAKSYGTIIPSCH